MGSPLGRNVSAVAFTLLNTTSLESVDIYIYIYIYYELCMKDVAVALGLPPPLPHPGQSFSTVVCVSLDGP